MYKQHVGSRVQADMIQDRQDEIDKAKAAKPDCYKCVHRLEVPGSAHSRCNKHEAKVTGNSHGRRMGWFSWPFNFDPVWLQSCDSFSDKPEDRQPRKEADPMVELFAMLR